MKHFLHIMLLLFVSILTGVFFLTFQGGDSVQTAVQVGRVGTDSSANYQERSLSTPVIGEDNLIIENNGSPLSTSTGFFVYTPNEVATSCYTVYTDADRLVTSTSAFHRSGQTFITWDEIATATDYRIMRGECPEAGSVQVEETNDEPQPIIARQQDGGYVFTMFMDQNNWSARGFRGQAYSFLFALPQGANSSTDMALSVHMDGLSTRYSFRTSSPDANSAYIRIDDPILGNGVPDGVTNTYNYSYPSSVEGQGWYFGHACDGEDPANGVCNYLEHAILRAVDNVQDIFAGIDSERVYAYGHSMGGTGAMRMGIRYPHVFAAVHSSNGVANFLTLKDEAFVGDVATDFVPTLVDNWGSTSTPAAFQAVGLTTSTMSQFDGDSPWDVQNMVSHVCDNRGDDTAFLAFSHRTGDATVNYDTQALPFWEAMDSCNVRFSAASVTGGHTANQGGSSPNWFRNNQFVQSEWNRFTLSGPMVAISNAPTTTYASEELQYNMYYQWSSEDSTTTDFSTSIVDTADTFQVDLRSITSVNGTSNVTAGPITSVDVTPRRTSLFQPTNGTLYYYSNKNLTSGDVDHTGTTTADIYDRVTVANTPIRTTDVNRLTITTNSSTLDNDSDGVFDPYDNCVNDANADQTDSDADGIGDVCDNGGGGGGSTQQTVTLEADKDAYVTYNAANGNTGAATSLMIEMGGGANARFVYVGFPTSSLEADDELVSSTIKFYVYDTSDDFPATIQYEMLTTTCAWEEGTGEFANDQTGDGITYSNRPLPENGPFVSSSLLTAEGFVTIDVTDYYDKDASFCGIIRMVEDNTSPNYINYEATFLYSSEYSAVEERALHMELVYNQPSSGPEIGFDDVASTVSEAVGTVGLDFSLSTGTTSSIDIGYEVYAVSTTAKTSGNFQDFTLLGTGTSTLDAGATAGTISVSITDDSIDENTETIAIRLTTSTLGSILSASSTHVISVTDNDTADVTVSNQALSITESGIGDTATFTIQLATQPTSTVEISIASSSPNEFTLSSSSVQFTSSTWNVPQTITLTIVDDDIDEDEETVDLTFSITQETAIGYIDAEIDIPTTTVTVTDDDTRNISNSRAGTNGSGRYELDESVANDAIEDNKFTIKLASEPTDDVIVTLVLTVSGQVTLTTSTYTFTAENWDTYQSIVATVVDDEVAEPATLLMGLVATASSTDPKYDELQVTLNYLQINDDDTAGVTLTTSTNAVTEGNNVTYTVVLDSEPTTTVDVAIANSDNSSISLSTSSIRFTSSTWDTPITVTVSAVQDVDSADESVVLTHSVSSAGYGYADLADQTYTIAVTDNDIPGVTISDAAVSVTEGGATDTFTVVLNTQPTDNVTVALAVNNGEVTLSTSSILFTSSTYNNTTTVTVTADNDTDVEGDHSSTISFTVTSADGDYSGVAVNSVTANITDNDVSATVSETAISVTEGAAAQTYSIVLDYLPTADVTISLTENSADFSLSTTSITFTAVNWDEAQTISVTAVDDAFVEETETSSISHTFASADARYNGLAVNDVTVSVTDNDQPTVGFAENARTVTEADGTQYVVLEMTTTSPYTVTVNYTVTGVTAVVSGSNRDVAISTSGSQSISAGNVTTSIPFSVIDDVFDEADEETFTITIDSVTNGQVGGEDTFTGTVQDNDAPPTIAWSSASSTGSESTSAVDLTLSLSSASRRDVAVAYAIYAPSTTASTGTDVVLAGTGTSTIEAGSTSAQIRLNVTDDGLIEGSEDVAIVISNPQNATLASPTTTVYTITDNDSAGVTRSKTSLSITEGSTGSYTLVLTAVPTTTVTVTLASSNNSTATVSPSVIAFTSSTWDTAQTITVAAVDDDERLQNQTATITHTLTTTDANFTDVAIASVSVSVSDNDQAGGGAAAGGVIIRRSSGSSSGGGSSSSAAPRISQTTPSVGQPIIIPSQPSASGVAQPLDVEYRETSVDESPETVVEKEDRDLRKQNPVTAQKSLRRSYRTGQRTVVSVAGATHALTVRSATAGQVTVLVESDPQEVTLVDGQTITLDSDNDGYVDLAVSYEGLDANGEPNITVENLTDVAEITEDGMSINAGSYTTANQSVTILLNMDNVSLVAFSNDPNFSDASFVPYNEAFAWTLSEGNGLKTVYARLRSPEGLTLDVSDTIVLTDQATIGTTVPPQVTCPLSIGSVYKSPEQSAVYYIAAPRNSDGTYKQSGSCTKRAFFQAPIYFTYFTSWDAVQVVDQSALDSIPNDALGFMPKGPLYRPQYGALVKTISDPKVYLLLNDKKYWITDEAVFTALGYTGSWIEDVAEELLAQYVVGEEITDTDTHPNYTLITYDNSAKVYRLEPDPQDPQKTVKRWISSPEVFNQLNFRWDRIVTVDRSEFYEEGESLQ